MDNTPTAPKKRGRKPKNSLSKPDLVNITSDNVIMEPNTQDENKEPEKPLPKKRGRKPKGGKIVVPATPQTEVLATKVNVIMHLKCSLKDLQTTHTSEMEPYNSQLTGTFEPIATDMEINYASNYVINNTQPEINNQTTCETPPEETTDETSKKEVWKKIKQLEHQLHHNYSSETSSACFWCTYPFDNPPIYIPKFYLKETYHVYGCFCSPECATAHLMQENIDSSIKFERYYLLNNIYGGVYNYTKNIKPAPSPFYMLDKFYGNLSIQEYRSLLSNERLFLVVDKPLTRVMPELHRANEDHIINNKMIPTNQGVKRVNKKTTTKNDILAENFGLNVGGNVLEKM
jgi:hypothetical protein